MYPVPETPIHSLGQIEMWQFSSNSHQMQIILLNSRSADSDLLSIYPLLETQIRTWPAQTLCSSNSQSNTDNIIANQNKISYFSLPFYPSPPCNSNPTHLASSYSVAAACASAATYARASATSHAARAAFVAATARTRSGSCSRPTICSSCSARCQSPAAAYSSAIWNRWCVVSVVWLPYPLVNFGLYYSLLFFQQRFNRYNYFSMVSREVSVHDLFCEFTSRSSRIHHSFGLWRITETHNRRAVVLVLFIYRIPAISHPTIPLLSTNIVICWHYRLASSIISYSYRTPPPSYRTSPSIFLCIL